MNTSSQQAIGSGFSRKTTASEVMSGIDLSGKTAVVTGGYSGIGLETVKALVAAGAQVIVPARDKQRADEALASAGLGVETIEMDLGNLASVYACAAEIGDAHDAIHLLINNAGIMACPETRVGPGWEMQFAVNHIGHFVLTRELMPYLLNANGARVVCLSSVANRRSPVRYDDIHFEREAYDKWAAYGQSKTANALFARELNHRRSKDGVQAFSVHPGGIMTPLQRHMKTEEMVEMGWVDKNGEISEQAKSLFKTPEQGASTTLWAATSPKLNDRGGEYCEDCDIASVAGKDTPRWSGVAPWAVDDEAAKRLWAETEAMVLSAEA